ncbi:chromo domain-containing protein [Heterostelium album PN500]|uniref:Chromo domain-containing protein n=1 Tax=Heterostelium pallidum (strain ATCC 26659 / Pp 5 / PN500) TaxID=670386 RepID=D3BMZ2_HETP5|nr:chromo domain-containing protein [Heterostelium album PN500]EFA77354.1 chromo domain-containing protein [Heterostelium album PN500]|eukprot:XP_020429483.1 chromo domain-containing protein [Heterostelium album PN500]
MDNVGQSQQQQQQQQLIQQQQQQLQQLQQLQQFQQQYQPLYQQTTPPLQYQQPPPPPQYHQLYNPFGNGTNGDNLNISSSSTFSMVKENGISLAQLQVQQSPQIQSPQIQSPTIQSPIVQPQIQPPQQQQPQINNNSHVEVTTTTTTTTDESIDDEDEEEEDEDDEEEIIVNKTNNRRLNNSFNVVEEDDDDIENEEEDNQVADEAGNNVVVEQQAAAAVAAPGKRSKKSKSEVADDFDSSDGKKESDDDYEPPSDEEEEEDDYRSPSPPARRRGAAAGGTRSRRSGPSSRLDQYDDDYLMDDNDEYENDGFVVSDASESGSDYEPNPRKKKSKKSAAAAAATKKKGKAAANTRGRRGRGRQQYSSEEEDGYGRADDDDDDDEDWAPANRPTRARRQTVRLYEELAGDGEEGGMQDVDDQQSADEVLSDAHSYSQSSDEYSDQEKPKRNRQTTSTTRKQSKDDVDYETITMGNLRQRNNNGFDYQAHFMSDEDEDEMMLAATTTTEKQVGPVETTEDTIERIVDHRLKTGCEVNENETTFNVELYEFLVKWKGWAHIHNTWDNYETLMGFKGGKKLTNYAKNIIELNQWRKEASREDIEQADIAKELTQQEYQESLKVERIIASREVEVTTEYPGGIQYLVKWGSTPYSDVTWEYPEEIKLYQNEIDDYLERQQAAQSNSKHTGGVSPKKRLEQGFVKFEEQPDWINAGKLRDYQMEGLNWLVHSWKNNTNVILADEMGLGKTIQTISFISYLFNVQNLSGPFLVVVPLSTIENWHREFTKWAPKMNLIVYTGSSASRDIIRQFEFYQPTRFGKKKISFNVLLTTYDFILKDKNYLGAIKWEYLAVDEAHRLKNNESMLHEVLKYFHTSNRLLVTGTPLQNSLKELWNLLNFLMPNKFHSLDEFQDQYADLKEKDQIAELHNVLKPHLLRRIKKEVEKSLPAKTERILRVDLSPTQKKYYRWILSKNFHELNKGVKGEKTTLLNIVAELKKTCNHPYLFENAEDLNAENPLDAMVKASGKLILLDKLLVRLKETGHRVLIFSQMVRMLDILADYLKGRGFLFQRLDGSTSREKRSQAMDRFNAEGSPDFAFLLSTRAGGLGINLSTADTVIIFDSDWNPQNDLQAEARAHRIGQKNTVNIYRLVSKSTIEEEILERAKQKMVLDHLVIQSMEKSSTKTTSSNVFNKEELDAILKFGAEDLFKEGDENSNTMQEMDIDEILSRAEQRESTGESTAGEELLNSFKVANFSTGDTNSKEETNWANIIPDKDRVAPVEEAPLYLPPRRARIEKSSAEPKKSQNEPITITKNPRKEITAFNKKELKSLFKSFRKFGNYRRSKEILVDCDMSNKPARATEEICREVIDVCRRCVKENPESDKIHVLFAGVDINASELVQKVEEMDILSQLCDAYVKNQEQFRVTFPTRPVSWAIKWGAKEDAMLLMGIHKYGNGNFESIQKDKSLGFESIISLTNDPQETTTAPDGSVVPAAQTKIKAATLQRRVDSLLKAAKDSVILKKKEPVASTAKIPLSKKRRRSRGDEEEQEPEEVEEVEETKSSRGRGRGKRGGSSHSRDSGSGSSSGNKSSRTSAHSTPTRGRRPSNKMMSSEEEVSEEEVVKQPSRRTSSGRVSVPPSKLNQSPHSSPSKRGGRGGSRSTTTTTTTTTTNNHSNSRRHLLSDEESTVVHSDRGAHTARRGTSSTSSAQQKKRYMDDSSGDEESGSRTKYDQTTLNKCKQYLTPIKKHLEKFKHLSDSSVTMSREDKLHKTKKYLLSLGNEITSVMDKHKGNESLENHLWYYASQFTARGGEELRQLFNKMKKTDKPEQKSTTTTTEQKPPMKLTLNLKKK